MTDIIKDAQQLLDGATPAPWEIRTFDPDGDIYGIGKIKPGYGGGDPLDCVKEDAKLAAAAPQLAQTLAEEEYQYGVTYIGLNHGEQHVQWVESSGDAEWDKDTLQWLIKRWKKQGQSPKIVRRRVSAPEICE